METAIVLSPAIVMTVTSIVSNLNEEGQVTVAGRVIKYKAKGRVHSLKWVYDGTAWDILSGISEKESHHKSKRGAIEPAMLKLLKRLKREGLLKDEDSEPQVGQEKETTVLEVVPDSEGSYEAHRMKPANPTADMLDPKLNYTMWSKCKGQAFILNNNRFDQGDREGSQVDTANIKHLFEELGYKIVLHQDLSKQEIVQKFKAFASSFDEEGVCYDSAVIVLMSHGDTGVIKGTDGDQVKLQDVERELESDKCPGLKGKPRMYFVQACRGSRVSVLLSHDGPCSLACPAETSFQCVEKEVPVSPDFTADMRDPADAHFAYATTEGYLSLRHNVRGSFFVQALCEVFFANAHQDSLSTLMKKVTKRVHRKKGTLFDPESSKNVDAKQTPECISRLRKNVYFLPKYSQT